MSQELVLVIIGLVVAVFVLRPLLKGSPKSVADATATPSVSGTASNEELAELELDHAMGRVSDADYDRWRGQMATVAEDAQVASSTGTDDAIARAESLVRQFRDRPPAKCRTCGDRPEPDARFCSKCGAALTA